MPLPSCPSSKPLSSCLEVDVDCLCLLQDDQATRNFEVDDEMSTLEDGSIPPTSPQGRSLGRCAQCFAK